MNTHNARTKIKAHIRRCGKQELILTQRIVKYWWNVCNYACFDGQLTPPRAFVIEEVLDEGALGWCDPCEPYNPDVEIHLLREYNIRSIFLTVLVHEMVHQWEWELYRKCGHGKRFISWAMFIEKELELEHSQFIDLG